MAAVGRIPRRRGGVCGLLLILLGAWGGLAPFVGPYFHFAFTPDKTWAYTTGRLYLSAIPGGVALLAGLLILATRSRAVGVLAGLLATLAGAWFVVGAGVVDIVLKYTSITPGVAVPRSSSAIPAATYTYLEQIGFFTGVGVLIIVCAAVAMGRFSMLSANDAVPADDYDDYSDQVGVTQPSGPFSPGPRPYAGEEPTQTQEPVPPFGTSDYPATSSSPFPPAEPPSSTFPRSNSQFG